MKFYTIMPSGLKPFFKEELQIAQNHFENQRFEACWHHLERGHILGQSYPIEHSIAHYEMLKFGVKTKNAREILGQIPRLIFGGVKSFVGDVPIGNTGGANVSGGLPMEIPADLKAILDRYL